MSLAQSCCTWPGMLLSLPIEIICMVAKLCSLGDQASLSQSCGLLHRLCKPILYRNDVENHSSSSVFHSLVHCQDQHHTLRILVAAKEGGADFTTCQDARKSHPLSFYRMDATLYSPLHLAARRGLSHVVAYLMDHGLDVDDKEAAHLSRKTPLMEAILNHQEATAMLMVRRGALRGLCPPDLEAFQATIREGLPCLLRIIVERHRLDVNAEIGYGCTPLVLAICHRKTSMIPTLLELGARALPAMRRFCNDHAFLSILWTIDSGSALLCASLDVHGVLELTFSIAAERVSQAQKNKQILALERFLKMLYEREQTFGDTGAPCTRDINQFLDALLQTVLSVDHTDTRLASLFQNWGATVHARVFLQLNKILESPLFSENTQRCLRQHPGLLHCLDFVYCHCLQHPNSGRDWSMTYFLNRVPRCALRLVEEMKKQDLPLTRRGLEMFGLASLESRSSLE